MIRRASVLIAVVVSLASCRQAPQGAMKELQSVEAGGSEVKPTPAPGRYEIATDFSMAGSWNLAVEWDGPKGRGSARLRGTVR